MCLDFSWQNVLLHFQRIRLKSYPPPPDPTESHTKVAEGKGGKERLDRHVHIPLTWLREVGMIVGLSISKS